MKKLLFGLIAAVLLSNLSYSQVNSTSIKGIISVDLKNKLVKEVSEISKNEDIVYSTVNLVFKCSDKMQTFSTEKELKEFISKEPTKVNGTVELFVDNELVFTTQIVDGEKTKEEVFNSLSTDKKYPCTYKGIRQCAIDGIHSQNWFEMATCIAEGFNCVVVFYINCTIDNC